jgi:hypothetical protein
MSNQQETISRTYYDPQGFGSIQKQLADARKADETISIDDIKQWRSKSIERTGNYKGDNRS